MGALALTPSPDCATQPATLVASDGRLRAELTPDQELRLWAQTLHEPGRGRVEVAAAIRRPDGELIWCSRQRLASFPPAGNVNRLVGRALAHRKLGREVFATPLSQRLPHPGRRGELLPGSIAWVDIDLPHELDKLRAFIPAPHLVVKSGSGGMHAYWRLAERHEPPAIWEINRKLAGALAGDQNSSAPWRLMRLPGTINRKVTLPCTLVFCHLDPVAASEAELVGDLPDPRPAPPPPDPELMRRWARLTALDDAKQIPPPVYFAIFAGVDVADTGAVIHCPLPDHDDKTASCQVYPGAHQGWVCRGCERGGSIYDLASLMEGGPGGRHASLHGDEFLELKRRVHERLLLLGHQ